MGFAYIVTALAATSYAVRFLQGKTAAALCVGLVIMEL